MAKVARIDPRSQSFDNDAQAELVGVDDESVCCVRKQEWNERVFGALSTKNAGLHNASHDAANVRCADWSLSAAIARSDADNEHDTPLSCSERENSGRRSRKYRRKSPSQPSGTMSMAAQRLTQERTMKQVLQWTMTKVSAKMVTLQRQCQQTRHCVRRRDKAATTTPARK